MGVIDQLCIQSTTGVALQQTEIFRKPYPYTSTDVRSPYMGLSHNGRPLADSFKYIWVAMIHADSKFSGSQEKEPNSECM